MDGWMGGQGFFLIRGGWQLLEIRLAVENESKPIDTKDVKVNRREDDLGAN